MHAVDYRPWALGFRSRYARPVLVPDHHTDEEGFVAALVRLGDSLAAPAPIFAVDDEDLAVLARNRDRLGERFRYPFPDWETLAPIMDKRVQLRRAVELGLPAPASGDEAEFPVLLKPLESVPFRLRFGVKAIRCDSPEELAAARERTSGFETFVVDWIPGGDDALYSLGAYLAPGGEALATFCFRKLRQDPPLLGNGRVVVAASEPLVVEQGLALLRGLGSHGLAHVEVKRDARDGLFKLVEVNSRLWQFPLARHGVRGQLPARRVPPSHRRASRARRERSSRRTLGDHLQGEPPARRRAAPVPRSPPRARRPGHSPRARALHRA